MTTKTQIKTLAIEAIETIAELELNNIQIDIIFSTRFGLIFTVFSKPDFENVGFFLYYEDDIEAGTEKINKLIETIKLDDYEEVLKLHTGVN